MMKTEYVCSANTPMAENTMNTCMLRRWALAVGGENVAGGVGGGADKETKKLRSSKKVDSCKLIRKHC